MDEGHKNLDILKRLEDLTDQVSRMVSERGKSVFARYPITFGILVLFGVIALSEGLKGILESVGILNGNPWYMFLVGLVILVVTGTVYRKLEK